MAKEFINAKLFTNGLLTRRLERVTAVIESAAKRNGTLTHRQIV
jgi:hypothetical protein